MRKLILAMCCISLLSACSVDSQRIEWADYVCKTNGGVAEIRRSGYFFTVAVCKNGARFDGTDFK